MKQKARLELVKEGFKSSYAPLSVLEEAINERKMHKS